MKNILILLTFIIACNAPYEQKRVIDINLGPEMDNPSLQVSGLDWYGDHLVLLTQIPDHFNSHLYSIPKKDILLHLAENNYKINVSEIYLDDALVSARLDSNNEYEAIAFKKDSVYLAIETDRGGLMKSWLVMGRMISADTLWLDESSLISIPLPKKSINEMACETIVVVNNSIYAFYEANGLNVNKKPTCYKLDLSLNKVQEIKFDHIEYRLTDATRAGGDNKFWVINNFYKGDLQLLKPAEDSLMPKTIGSADNEVKRLIELQAQNDRVTIASKKTIMLEPVNCNWEGLARLDNAGFLIANDTYAPDRKRTRLAFIKYKINE